MELWVGALQFAKSVVSDAQQMQSCLLLCLLAVFVGMSHSALCSESCVAEQADLSQCCNVQVLAVDALRQERVVSSGHDHTCRVWKIAEESQLIFRAYGMAVDCCKYITGALQPSTSQASISCNCNMCCELASVTLCLPTAHAACIELLAR